MAISRGPVASPRRAPARLGRRLAAALALESG